MDDAKETPCAICGKPSEPLCDDCARPVCFGCLDGEVCADCAQE